MPFFDFTSLTRGSIASSSSSISISSSAEDDASSTSPSSLSSSPLTCFKPPPRKLRKMALSRSSSRESGGPGSSQGQPMAVNSMVADFVQAQAMQALEDVHPSDPNSHNGDLISNATCTSFANSATVSMTSSSHNSPIMTSNTPTLTSGGSVVPSPEPLRGRDHGPTPISSFQLPEAMLSQKMSSPTLPQCTPLPSVVPGNTSNSMSHEAISRQNSSIIRRLSTKASKAITRRRPSSAHPNSRDVSVGPGILRRRSDSTNTAPPSSDVLDHSTFDSDSEYEADERDDGESISASTFDGAAHTEVSVTTNATSSATGSTVAVPLPVAVAQVGPVIPLALLHGIPIRKVSKKNNNKRIVLTLDAEAGKITWDKSHPAKRIYIDDINEIRTAEDIRQYRLDCNVPESEEGRFFTILYTVPDTTQTKLMHLIADTDESFMDWTTTLDAIYKHRQDLMASLMAFNDKAVRAYWNREMAKQSSEKVSSASSAASALTGEIDFAGVERVCRNLHIHVSQDTLRTNFNEADVLHTGRLNYAGFQEFVRLMKKRADIQTIYRSTASNAALGITRDEFFDFLRNIQGENVDDELPAWETVFARFARRPKALVRSDSATISDGEQSATSSNAEEAPRISEASLAAYLTSTYNLSLIQEPKEYTFDRPMNEYYISSSHNTYLVGRQIAGTSSVDGYITALRRGCRCVEIDCWDGADGQPVVVHGKTWTSSISFREAINAINRYAFSKSPFPLWISLEVHCNAEQQRIMARIMRDVFGSKLVTEPLDSATNRLPTPSQLKGRILVKTKRTQQVPPTLPPLAPLTLQTSSEVIAAATAGTGEFLGRRRGNSLPSSTQKALSLDILSPPSSAVVAPTTFMAASSPLSYTGQASPIHSPGYSMPTTPRKPSTPKTRVKMVTTITEGEVQRNVARAHGEVPSSSASDCDSGSEKLPTKQKQSKIVHELGSLAVYCMGIHKATPLDDADCKLFNHILSWDEAVYDKFTKTRESRRSVYRHNMRYMMRVYPKAYRIASSNFSPLAHWRRGVQMVALNWQTYDLGMQLNAAMFAGGSDQSGYVLKPRECREFQVLPNLPGETKPRDLKRERKNVNFSIGIISAQQLMRPVNFPDRRTLDPYIEVEVFLADDKRDREEGRQQTDHPAALTPLLYRTKIAAENGFNPVFDQRFNFRFTTKYPDLVFVRLSVKLAENGRYTSNQATATFTAKLSNLKQGYRTIRLVDMNSDHYMFSTLLCEIHKEPITSVFVPASETPESSKLRSIRTVFNRSNNMSPKSSLDSGPS